MEVVGGICLIPRNAGASSPCPSQWGHWHRPTARPSVPSVTTHSLGRRSPRRLAKMALDRVSVEGERLASPRSSSAEPPQQGQFSCSDRWVTSCQPVGEPSNTMLGVVALRLVSSSKSSIASDGVLGGERSRPARFRLPARCPTPRSSRRRSPRSEGSYRPPKPRVAGPTDHHRTFGQDYHATRHSSLSAPARREVRTTSVAHGHRSPQQHSLGSPAPARQGPARLTVPSRVQPFWRTQSQRRVQLTSCALPREHCRCMTATACGATTSGSTSSPSIRA